jgi:hypothetical protein
MLPRRTLALGLLLLATAEAEPAGAYPQYIAKGYARCSECHFSPNGGGMTTASGRGEIEAVLPDLLGPGWLERLSASANKEDPTGRAEGSPALQANFGVDSRLLFLRTSPEVGVAPQWMAIPMLAEAGAIAALGPWSLYATVSPRIRSTAEHTYTAVSREHWLGFELDEVTTFRAGRMVLPFGLRMPDHTLYTREDFGFDKFDQSYAVAWHRVTDASELHLAAFAGDLWLDPPALQEHGAVVSYARSLADERVSLGGSLLFGATTHTLRPAASVFLRAHLGGGAYVLGELAGQRSQPVDGRAAQSSAAGFLRLGWFVHSSTDLYAEASGRVSQGGPELTKLRYQLGLNSHLLPWVELSPAIVLEEDVETGLKTNVLGQLHIFY